MCIKGVEQGKKENVEGSFFIFILRYPSDPSVLLFLLF